MYRHCVHVREGKLVGRRKSCRNFKSRFCFRSSMAMAFETARRRWRVDKGVSFIEREGRNEGRYLVT